jgi:hypothetical protein
MRLFRRTGKALFFVPRFGHVAARSANSWHWRGAVRGLKLDVLEFLGDEKARDLRASAVLPDKVYVLQFSYRSRGEREVCTVCGGGVSGDTGTSRVVGGGGGDMGKWPLVKDTRGKRMASDDRRERQGGLFRRYRLFRRWDTEFARCATVARDFGGNWGDVRSERIVRSGRPWSFNPEDAERRGTEGTWNRV